MPLAGFNAAQGQQKHRPHHRRGLDRLARRRDALVLDRSRHRRGQLKRFAARHGRWLTLSPDDIDQANRWFERRGALAVLIGRLIPTVRTFISVPAGVAAMPLPKFLLWSAIGTVAWTALLALAGYFLESQYERVSEWVNPVSTAVVVGIVAFYLYRVVTYRKRVPAARD